MRKRIKRVVCVIFFIVLLGCTIYVGLSIYGLYADPFGTEAYSKRNLNYIRGQSDFIFQLPQKEFFVKTSKLQGGRFIIYFAPDSLSLDNSKDSIEYGNGTYSRIIVDTTNIYVDANKYRGGGKILNIGKNHFNIIEVDRVFDSLLIKYPDSSMPIDTNKYCVFDSFFENGKRKHPYSFISIDIKEYSVYINGETVKQGNIYGGW